MSGLEALGVVCNIMQIISFAHETINLCKAIYQGQQSPDVHLKENAISLAALSGELQKYHQDASLQSTDERRLAEIAKKCNIAARALENEIIFITDRQTEGNLVSTLRVVAKVKWRKARLERLEKSLRECQMMMESHLLFRVCKKSDAIELQQSQRFRHWARTCNISSPSMQPDIPSSSISSTQSLYQQEFISRRKHLELKKQSRPTLPFKSQQLSVEKARDID